MYLIYRSPNLGERMDNDAFKAHLESTGPGAVCELSDRRVKEWNTLRGY